MYFPLTIQESVAKPVIPFHSMEPGRRAGLVCSIAERCQPVFGQARIVLRSLVRVQPTVRRFS